MLNCFFWYPTIWFFILILYSFDISLYNQPINTNLMIFIVTTSFISTILGLFLKKEFQKIQFEEIIKISNKNIYMILIGFILEFIYCKNIPFLDIAILHKSNYGDFSGIPFVHVILIGFSSYAAVSSFYNYLCTNKKKYLLNFILILFMFLLLYARSMIIINVFMALLMFVEKHKTKKDINFKHLVIFFISILSMCYLYGGVGNLRDGYSWNDNSYIERLGLYNKFPSFIPKQYMWTYSYLTTPLANLNYNINNIRTAHSIQGSLYEFLPKTISKRLFPSVKEDDFILIRTYFNAVTGWCNIYVKGGFLGMYMLYFYLIIITIFSIKLTKLQKNKSKRCILFSILCIINIFMFFYNTLNYVGISFTLWIIIICLLPRIKIRSTNE